MSNLKGRPKNTTGQATTLTDKELKRVESIIANGNHPIRNQALLTLSFKLGLRIKELASLTIEDVYQDGHIKPTLHLTSDMTKGAKHRDIALTNPKVITDLLALIKQRQSEDVIFNTQSPLFKSQKGSRFSPNALSRVLKDIYINAGLYKASSHSGRRTLITKLAEANIDINSIRQIAGHTSLNTTMRYIQSNPNKLADILKNC
jgi:integrase/recombinase XerD